MLAVEDIHVHYGRLEAVRGVSIEVAEGEAVCVVGPNGAGKTTMLAAIAGILTPTTGNVSFDGQAITGMAPENVARRGISLVPEGRHVFTRLTVEENLRVGTGMRRDRREVEADFQSVMQQFPLLRERRYGAAGKLSGGEQQQLVIARALLTRPRLMMIDEPALGLAPRMIEQVYAVLGDLRTRRQMTLLIVEQSTERAVRMADRVYVLRSGRVVLEGRSGELAGDAKLEEKYFGFEAAAGRGGPRH